MAQPPCDSFKPKNMEGVIDIASCRMSRGGGGGAETDSSLALRMSIII